MQWIIYHDLHDGWRWRFCDDAGELMAASTVSFSRYVECVADAKLHGYPLTVHTPKAQPPDRGP